jgi:hypothetical protein
VRESVGTIAKGSRQLTTGLDPADPTTRTAVGATIKIVGDRAGNLRAGSLTTLTVRKVEFL